MRRPRWRAGCRGSGTRRRPEGTLIDEGRLRICAVFAASRQATPHRGEGFGPRRRRRLGRGQEAPLSGGFCPRVLLRCPHGQKPSPRQTRRHSARAPDRRPARRGQALERNDHSMEPVRSPASPLPWGLPPRPRRPPPLGLELAAMLACGPTAVLSHHTAARRHGLSLPGSSRMHITVPRRRAVPNPVCCRTPAR